MKNFEIVCINSDQNTNPFVCNVLGINGFNGKNGFNGNNGVNRVGSDSCDE